MYPNERVTNNDSKFLENNCNEEVLKIIKKHVGLCSLFSVRGCCGAPIIEFMNGIEQLMERPVYSGEFVHNDLYTYGYPRQMVVIFLNNGSVNGHLVDSMYLIGDFNIYEIYKVNYEKEDKNASFHKEEIARKILEILDYPYTSSLKGLTVCDYTGITLEGLCVEFKDQIYKLMQNFVLNTLLYGGSIRLGKLATDENNCLAPIVTSNLFLSDSRESLTLSGKEFDFKNYDTAFPELGSVIYELYKKLCDNSVKLDLYIGELVNKGGIHRQCAIMFEKRVDYIKEVVGRVDKIPIAF